MYTIPTDIYISLMCRIFTVFSCIISIYFRDRPVDFILLVLLVQQQQQQNDSDILCLFFVHILILDILICY